MLQKFKRTAVSWELRRAKRFLFRGEQQLAERNFYASIIPKGLGSIIDVGANAGAKTEIFQHLAKRVVAIVVGGGIRNCSRGLLKKAGNHVKKRE